MYTVRSRPGGIDGCPKWPLILQYSTFHLPNYLLSNLVYLPTHLPWASISILTLAALTFSHRTFVLPEQLTRKNMPDLKPQTSPQRRIRSSCGKWRIPHFVNKQAATLINTKHLCSLAVFCKKFPNSFSSLIAHDAIASAFTDARSSSTRSQPVRLKIKYFKFARFGKFPS